MGGFKAQARNQQAADLLVEEALAYQQAGAFSLLVEGVFEAAARQVTEAVTIPTIGIGASPACDGQVLVTEDMLGLFTDFTPKFARQYVNLSTSIAAVFAEFEADVRSGKFPTDEHCFGMNTNHD